MKKKDIKFSKKQIITRILENNVKNESVNLIDLIHDVLYYERKRLKREYHDKKYKKDKAFFKKVAKNAKHSSISIQRKLIKQITSHYLSEITSEFKPIIYEISTKVLPVSISAMLNNISIKKVIKNGFMYPPLNQNIVITGEYKKLQKIANKGTLIIVPTHLSNLDSPLVGLVIYMLGIDPLVYGAGLNLFKNKFFGFFMSRLGAYKVDRKKKSQIYKDILKEYATVSLEMGYGNLFFPGGTRSRSGVVENKLKKGLLGTGLDAYQNNLKNNKQKPDIFFVPLTLNYQVVLEAETLISDFLAEAGKSRYIIDDDASFKISKIASFFEKMINLDAKILFNFGDAIDPFGNPVDEDGNSIDVNGNIIDKEKYLFQNAKLVEDEQRNRAYTDILSKEILKSYKKNNIIMSVNFVSFVAFRLFKAKSNDSDFFNFIKEPAIDLNIKVDDFHKESSLILKKLIKMHENKEITLSELVLEGDSEKILNDALKFSTALTKNSYFYKKGLNLYTDNLKLLYYYHNSLDSYGL